MTDTQHQAASKKSQEGAQAEEAKPVAWSYELATAFRERDGQYVNWEWRLTRYEPIVPPNSIRNLTPLYARPYPVNDGDAKRLHCLQTRQATVEIVTVFGGYWCFRVAGMNAAVNSNIREAIDAAMLAAAPTPSTKGGVQ